jgi:uncharacterized membrane protein
VSSLDGVLVWLDGGVCSQNPAHSFWIDGRPLPLCARDLGLFGGFLLVHLIMFRRPVPWSRLYLLGLLPLTIDGANSFVANALGGSPYPPSNAIRLATGLLAGAALALALLQSVCAEARYQRRPERRQGSSPLLPAVLAGSVAATLVLSPYLAVTLAATASVLLLLASASRLLLISARWSWALALPELALLAIAKQAALAVLR